MKILFITMFPLQMNTSATLQNLIIIDGLKELGYSIDVITTSLDESHSSYDETLSLKNVDNYYKLEIPKIYDSLRSKKKQGLIKKTFKKLIKSIYIEFEIYDGYKSVISKIDNLKLINFDYDYIISASDPKSSHLLTAKVIDKFQLQDIPWIQYWGDPMAIDITRKKKYFFEYRVKKEEERLLSLATKVFYATPLTSKKQSLLYPKYANKINFDTQGYWKEYRNYISTNSNDKKTVGYFGNYNPAIRDILPFYNSNDDGSYEIFIGGNGRSLEEKENTKILGYLSHQDIKKYENCCNVLVCVLNNKGTQIPGKLYYYASFNKPILVILDGEYQNDIKEFLDTFDRFYFCDNNSKSINTTITNILLDPAIKNFDLPHKLSPKFIAEKLLED